MIANRWPSHCASCGRRRTWGVVLLGWLALSAYLDASAKAAFLYVNQTVVNGTGAPQSSMTVYLAGDVTTDLDEVVNPFGPSGAVSITYIASVGLTQVVFTGTTPVAPGAEAHWGLGIDGQLMALVSGYWDDESNLFPVMTLSYSSDGPIVPPIYYGLFYQELALPGSASTARVWAEAPMGDTGGAFKETNNFDAAPQDEFDLGGTVLSTIDSVVGGWYYFLPLENLNEMYVPPPPENELLWFVPDHPEELAPGEMAKSSLSIPEPTTVSLAVAGLLTLGAVGIMRRRKS